MQASVEIDMVVKDSLQSLAIYENVFEVERIEVTNYAKGNNEAVFKLYGSRIHMLDENPDYMLVAPGEGGANSMWLNLIVPDIQAVYDKALKQQFTVIQPVTAMKEMGIINAMLRDLNGYVWMLHQIVEEKSFEERCQVMEEKMSL